VGTSGRAEGKEMLCVGQSVTLKGRAGLMEAHADGKPMQILTLIRMTAKQLE
jgi:hypothetical protein